MVKLPYRNKNLNVVNPKKKLGIIINTFVSASIENPAIDYVNEFALHRIVISSTKAYHTKMSITKTVRVISNYKKMV